MVDFERLLRVLVGSRVQFILIGGVAATVHGSSRLTSDLDVVYARGDENLRRVVEALEPYSPYLRGAPAGLPFRFDFETLRHGVNFTLTTSLGALDLLGEVPGGGRFEDLVVNSSFISLFGVDCRCANLDALIRMKRAAGRPKDLETVSELEALRDEQADAGN